MVTKKDIETRADIEKFLLDFYEDVKADETIDAKGMLVFPGGIDPHVHLDMPFMGTFSSDNYETGTRAALHGGTTTVIDFILQQQGHSLYDAYEAWSSRAAGNASSASVSSEGTLPA